ncbi:RagB/SusD family nutrient uptake outer membrane protein [Fibrivirga algicola]|uniref:RagB/SusD family nutrient uptake outer membrane protein n=1 Tax=Fibrivirga algicola TaxID=2950420 RepID=A0ABX0QHJ2_9BACT|nr:RagB/SusD family nutrient uptake outer membrane protein [Fibrivirga algicola]NID10716.1 RagB/SusD family nutrient uptake outer membrane protein [Fibrivirga algicola]
MKKILIILFLLTASVACQQSDDFLEPKTSALTEELVFTDSTRTMAFLSRIYSDIGFSFVKGRWDSHGNTEEATDDAEYKFSGTGQKAVVLYSGTVSPTNFPFFEFWSTPYNNIRRVNLLLEKLPSTPLSAPLKARMAAEARFLRAWYYDWLLISFGGVPLIGDKVFDIEDFINQPRNSYAECVTYLTTELDAAAAQLPAATDYSEQNYGRVTKGACLALKSRILLQAASPLFNGGAETTDAELAKIVSTPTYDASLWQKAADAAQAVINTGTYSLNVDNTTAPGYGFSQVFLKRVNSEYIIFQNRGANRDMEGFYNPASRGGANNAMPTHNLAEAFPMRNGKPITDPTSGYDPKNPYLNRDPRFGYSIIYNESPYYLPSANALSPVFTYENAPTDGFTSAGQTTGYYSRKMCDVNISANSSFNTNRGWPLLRYAEILLNYAEAINEAGQTALAYPKLIELRSRAGILPGADNLYGLKANMTKEEMREVVRTERRIELAFEDHRWNDIRRWKTAMVVNNGFNKRIRIVRSGTTYTYEVVNSIRQHNFRPEMYLLPIPDSEVRKAPAMRQNPGW